MITLVCLEGEIFSSAYAMAFESCQLSAPSVPLPPPPPPPSAVESTYDTFYSFDDKWSEPVVIDTGMDTVKVTCRGCFHLRMFTLCMVQVFCARDLQ